MTMGSYHFEHLLGAVHAGDEEDVFDLDVVEHHHLFLSLVLPLGDVHVQVLGRNVGQDPSRSVVYV